MPTSGGTHEATVAALHSQATRKQSSHVTSPSDTPHPQIPSLRCRAEDTGVTPNQATQGTWLPFLFPLSARTQRSIIMSAVAPPLGHPDSSTPLAPLIAPPHPPTPTHSSHFRRAAPPSFSQALGSRAPGQ